MQQHVSMQTCNANVSNVQSQTRHAATLQVLGVPLAGAGDAAAEAKFGGAYSWQPSNDPAFFPGRQAKVLARGQEVGAFGIVHPEVCQGPGAAVLGRRSSRLWNYFAVHTHVASCVASLAFLHVHCSCTCRRHCLRVATSRHCNASQPYATLVCYCCFLTHDMCSVLCFQVLASFDIPYPVSALELNLEPFCFDQFYRPLLAPPQ